MEYAGFWKRFIAFVVDVVIIVLGVLLILMIEVVFDLLFSNLFLDTVRNIHILHTLDSTVGFAIFGLFYQSLFESSAWQATPGKRFLGIKVVDYEGKRLDFPQAFARVFCMYFSTLTLGIGYLMIAFTKHKQGLHDMIAKCYLIRV